MAADGSTVRELDEDKLRADLEALYARGEVQALTICFINAYINGAHERRAREIAADDTVIEKDGVKVVVDPAAVMFVLGTEIDWVEDKLGAMFVFRNPNEKARCGCGESFSV